MFILGLALDWLKVFIDCDIIQIETSLKRDFYSWSLFVITWSILGVKLMNSGSKWLIFFVEEIKVTVKCVDLVAFGLIFMLQAKSIIVEQLNLAVYLFVSHHKINNKS